MSDRDGRAVPRWMVWLAYAVLLLVAAAWLYTIRENTWIGFYTAWPGYLRWASVAAALLLVPLLGKVRGKWPRILIGLAGFAAMYLTVRADALAIWIIESRLPRLDPLCGWRPPVVPLLGYMGVGWLPLVLRAQVEACELLAGRGSIEAMTLQRRWIGLCCGVLLGFAVGEAAMFFGADQCQASRFEDLELLAVGPMLALLLLELCVRASRTAEPRYQPIAWPDRRFGPRVFDRPWPDPVALMRAHAALRWARVVGGLVVVSGLGTLWFVIDQLLVRWPPRPWHLLVAALALLGAAVLATAPRPRPDPRRQPPAPDHGLTDRLRGLLVALERLRGMLEQGRDGAIWEFTVSFETALASLSERERELLESRGANLEVLVAAIQRVHPISEELGDATRRAIHTEVLRFLACARDPDGEDPYRGRAARLRSEPSQVQALDRTLRLPSVGVFVGLLLVLGATVVMIAHEPNAVVIGAALLGLVVRALALGYARRMFVIAVPARAADRSPSGYSSAFEHERARVGRSRRWAVAIGAVLASGLCLMFVGALADASAEPWLWIGDWLFVARMERLTAVNLLAVGLLVIPRIVTRLREHASVARVHRLHRASVVSGPGTLLIELIAQRLAWAERPYEVVPLERCAALLGAATELGALAPGDRDRLLERVADAIARGAGLGRRQRRALEIELATAERLLGLA